MTDAGPPTDRRAVECLASSCRWWCAHIADDTHVVVTLVPDRTDPTLDYQSRGALSALRLAAEESGYAHVADSLTNGCDDVVPAISLFERVGRAAADGQPMIKPASVGVLMISEAPDSELPAVVLKMSLRMAAARAGNVAVVGPTFSGTAVPLRRALDGSGIPSRRVVVYTSAASSPRVADILAPYELHRMTATDAQLTDALHAFLRETQGIGPNDDGIYEGVAILRETGTGWSALEGAQRPDCRAHPCPQVELTFPYRITALRTRWQEEQAAEVEALRGGGSAPSHSTSSEDPPDVSRGLDGALRRLLSEVAAARVRYVGIEATYAGDAIYLTHQLHVLAPDARVFLMSSDILFTTDEAAGLVGTYVVTSYPYLGTDDFWVSDVQRRHMTFVNDGAEATYNAAMFALASFEPAAGTGCAHGLTRPAELDFCGTERSEAAVPVWLGVIGANGFEPIAHHCVGAAAERRCDIRLDREIVPPNLWLVLLLLVGWGLEIDRRRVLAALERVASSTDSVRGQVAMLGLASRVLWYGVAAWLLTVHLTAAWHVYEGDAPMGWIILYGPIALAMVPRLSPLLTSIPTRFPRLSSLLQTDIFGPPGSATWRSAIEARGKALDARTTTLLLALTTLACALNCIVVLPPALAWLGEAPSLFALRTLSLSNMASPAVPVLLVLAAIWVLVRGRTSILRGVALSGLPNEKTSLGTLLDDATPSATSGPPTQTTDVTVAETRLRGLWLPDFKNLLRFFTTIFMFMAPPVLLAVLIKNPSTIEPRVVGWIIAATSLLAVSLVIGFVLELRALRERLDALLRALVRHPMSVFLQDIPLVVAHTVDTTLSRPSLQSGERIVGKLLRIHDVVVRRYVPHDPASPPSVAERVAALARWLRDNVVSDPSVETPKAGEPTALRWILVRPPPADVSPAVAREDARILGSIVAAAVAIVVAQYVRLVRHYVVHLTLASMLMIATITFYPFQPRGYFLLWAWIIVGSIAAMSITVFVDLDRDVVLSRIGRTVPGRFKIDGAFALRVVTYAVVPILSLVASQHPDVAHWLFSLFDPFLRALR